MQLTQKELEEYARKIIKFYFPNANVSGRMAPKSVVFALCLHEESVAASARIKFLEEIWKGTVNPASLRSVSDVLRLLKEASKQAVKGYLNDDVKLMVQSTIRRNLRSAVEMYFNYGMTDVHPLDVYLDGKGKGRR